MNQNPYISPATSLDPSRGANRKRLLWLVAAWLLILLSLPVAWVTIELLNQEYWGFWSRSWNLTGFSSNGSSISVDAVIVVLALFTVLLWLSSFGFYQMARMKSGKVGRQEKGDAGNGGQGSSGS